MDIVLDVAFIIAVTAFFKEQLQIGGKAALGLAFLVALIVGIAPLIGGMVPAAAPFIDVVIKVVVLFLGAAGSYDAVMDLRYKAIE